MCMLHWARERRPEVCQGKPLKGESSEMETGCKRSTTALSNPLGSGVS